MKIIGSKIMAPELSVNRVVRPRLVGLFEELKHSYGIVWVIGTAGSGKTTAVLEAVAGTEEPVAWLTLDDTESAPGRLLVYLEAALRRALPDLALAGTGALADDMTHVEAAGLLAEEILDSPVTLVIDEVERLADSPAAIATLRGFLRYAPPSLHMFIISRRQIPLRLGGERDIHGTGLVAETDLAFTLDEARTALENLGHASIDIEALVSATGGWVAGVLFDSWRSLAARGGSESDGLRGYLADNVMAQLSGRQRDFLVATSVLDEVTPRRAEALGHKDGGETMAELVEHHLPATFTANGLIMRCHTRFREYLLDELQREGEARARDIRRAHGRLLFSEGRYEEAVDEFITGQDYGAAFGAAERAAPVVLKRLDIAVAERWLSQLDRFAVEQSEPLTYAEMLGAVEREEWAVGAAHADRLLDLVRRRGGNFLEPSIASAVAWCYYLIERLDDARLVAAKMVPSPQADAMRFATHVDLADSEVHYRDRPANSGTTSDALLARIDLSHGRFARLLEPAAAPWGAVRSSQLGALRALGRLDEAQALYKDSPVTDWTMIRVYVELLADLGRPEEARSVLVAGRSLLDRSGSSVFHMWHALLNVMLDVRFGGAASRILAALEFVEQQPTARMRLRIAESLDVWWGAFHLREGDLDRSAEYLRRAVSAMVRWDRLLMLPTAAIYLAEVEWQLGDPEAADTAADLALETSHRTGSTFLLSQALKAYPAVLSRRLDAIRGGDSEWHDLGRSLLRGATSAGRPTAAVVVREFGEPTVSIDGRTFTPKLIKSTELLAYLAAHGGAATRADLLDALFDGRSDHSSRSYLRQAVNGLRKILPTGALLIVDAVSIRWEGEPLVSDSILAQAEFERANHKQGRDRLDAYLSVVDALTSGVYLQNARSNWVDDRAEALKRLLNDARHEAAQMAFELGEYVLADTLIDEVVQADPYREASWRVAMRVAGALGHGDRVIALFRDCEGALMSVNAEPAESTRQLLDTQRR